MIPAGPPGETEPTPVLLVSAHGVIRSALSALLERESDLRLVGACGSLAEAGRRLAAASPRVVVLEAAAAGGPSPVELQRMLGQAGSGTAPALVVIGASADEAPLSDRIRVAAGQRPAPERGPDDLSARETEVLGLIAIGHTNGEIAERLYLSVRTVESHRAHIQQKTGRSSRAELVAYARRHGIA